MSKRLLACLLILSMICAGCTSQSITEPDSSAPTRLVSTEALQTETTDTEEDLTEPLPATMEPLTTEPPQTEPPVTEPPVVMTENSAFTGIAGSGCDAAILGVIYNAPFVDGDPIPTGIWNEGEYDQLVIYPRWVGSELTAWRILRAQDEEGEFEYLDGPVYSSVCKEGDCVGAALERPEGGDAWAISITAPDGSIANFELSYNGRYGTFAYEYLTDNSAVFDEESLSLDPAIVTELTDAVSEDAFCSLLRAAARMGRDPWAVMERYCSPLGNYGDSAAYTLCQGDMDGDSYYLQAARLREGYDPGEGSIAERTAAQAARYAEIGNAQGILRQDREDGEPLYFDLDGITVYNPTLLAREVTVIVNGIETGTYELEEGDFVTLLDVCAGELPADAPIEIEIRVTESRGAPSAAILEVWPGVGGNISGAR